MDVCEWGLVLPLPSCSEHALSYKIFQPFFNSIACIASGYHINNVGEISDLLAVEVRFGRNLEGLHEFRFLGFEGKQFVAQGTRRYTGLNCSNDINKLCLCRIEILCSLFLRHGILWRETVCLVTKLPKELAHAVGMHRVFFQSFGDIVANWTTISGGAKLQDAGG